MPKSELEKLKTEFLEYLEIERNRSLLTIRNYDRYLSKFIDFADHIGITAARGITAELVRNYRLALNRQKSARGRRLKIITQNYHIIALRSFLKYLVKRDIKTLAAEKLELAKPPSRQVSFLEGKDLEKLLHAPIEPASKNELAAARDKAILELLFSTGLRVSELTGLGRREINLDKGEFSVKGKGDKIRIVFISDQAAKALKKYLALRQDAAPALFSLTPRSIQRIVKKYALLAGINPRITPHTLRHTMATDLLAAGADIRSVQEILGHSSITTTQIYTHITNKRLREVHKQYHGRFRRNR